LSFEKRITSPQPYVDCGDVSLLANLIHDIQIDDDITSLNLRKKLLTGPYDVDFVVIAPDSKVCLEDLCF